jgi:DNA/RNA endonuclease G (NUC1)/polyhydroxyalkanoate synthesis regulator phasin
MTCGSRYLPADLLPEQHQSSKGNSLRNRIGYLVVFIAAFAATSFTRPSALSAAAALPEVRISEFHYDNTGTDTGEAIEVSGPAGMDVTGWTVVLYNGSGGALYTTTLLSGAFPATCGTRGVIVLTFPSNGIQNGSPDGIALVDASNQVMEFLSYEGTFTAVGGPANGMVSTDIGVAETGTEPIGLSLQRTGTNTWTGPIASTFGLCNDTEPPPPAEVASVVVSPASATIVQGGNQQFAATAYDSGNQPIAGVTFTWTSSDPSVASVNATGLAIGVSPGDTVITATSANGKFGTAALHVDVPPPPPPLSEVRFSELHYDNLGTDVNEAIEIEGPAGTDLTGWSVVLYNGDPASGAPYDTRALGGTITASCSDRGVVTLFYLANGIQNGSPDGLALVNASGVVVEFLSYEGAFSATSGPAAGMTSMDIGVAETSTPAGQSLQRDANQHWSIGTATLGLCNLAGPPPPSTNSISFTGRVGGDPALPVGFQDQLFATLRDAGGATLTTTIVWTAETPDTTSVDQDGVITALAAGTAVVRATAADGTTATYALPTHVAVASTTAVYAGNTEFGEPADADPSDDFIVRHDEYTTSYNPNRNTPNWVSYDLEQTHFGAEDRCDCFTFDPALPGSFFHYTMADYTGAGAIAGFGIDRGHLARSFDRTSASLDNAFTFYFSNIVPQAADLNQGPWAIMENYLGDLARFSNKEVYVIAGVAGNNGTVKNEGHIVIPSSTWKVAVIMPRDHGLADIVDYRDIEVIAVNMPNMPGIRNVDWNSYRTTVDAIESLSGYDLLALLPDKIENIVEADIKPPIATVNGPFASSEGGAAVSMSAAGSLDPNGNIVSYAWNFGDGTTTTGQDVTHTYSQDGAYTVTLVVTDNDGLTDTITTTASIANVAPAIGDFAGASGLLPGEVYAAAGSFADPGADTWSATVDYGDGAGQTGLALAGKSFTLSHTYTAAGTFTVTVRISDDDTTSTATGTVTVITPQQALRDAGALIDQLVAAGKISAMTGQSLNSRLAKAVKDLDRGDIAEAIDVLQSFLSQLDVLVRKGMVSSADVEPLRTLVTRVIQSISS